MGNIELLPNYGVAPASAHANMAVEAPTRGAREDAATLAAARSDWEWDDEWDVPPPPPPGILETRRKRREREGRTPSPRKLRKVAATPAAPSGGTAHAATAPGAVADVGRVGPSVWREGWPPTAATPDVVASAPPLAGLGGDLFGPG